MLKVTVFRAEMDLVKANMLVLRDLTGAEAGGEDTGFILESPENSEEEEEEEEDVSEENEDSEEVGDPEWEPSSSITLSSPMDANLIRNFLSMMF